jgi:hypothetical protein
MAVLCVTACSSPARYVLHDSGLVGPACSFVIRDKQDGEVCAIDGKSGGVKYSFWSTHAFPVVPGEGCPNEKRFNDEGSGTFEAELAPGSHTLLVKPWDGFAVPTSIAFDCAGGKTYSLKMTIAKLGKLTSESGALDMEHGMWRAAVIEASPAK